MRVGIIGAGPGGICAGIRLKQSGYGDVIILEQAPGIGGTWWHNSYPGCACDVPSHLYSFSFATRQEWPQPYGTQPEVRAYLEDVVDRFGIRDRIRLNTKVEAARWDDSRSEWRVVSAAGEDFAFDVLIGAVGLFNLPVTPDIPGLDRFGGTKFHSARWNHDHDLTGEAVAVIGSAASATQFLPRIAPKAGRLDVYQRTSNWVRPRDDVYTAEQQARFRADPAAAAQERETIWGWVDAIQTLDDPVTLQDAREICLKNLEAVTDPETRRKLTPDYPFGGKRPIISNDFYPTFNRPNVHLITDPIAKITPDAVVTADGTARQVDTIILATGFDTMRFLSAVPITGRGGRRLDDAWAEAPEAYLGITVSGFPNLFMLYGPNTNNGSIIFQIECQVEYALRHIRRMDRQRLAWIDVKREAMRAFNETLQDELKAVAVWNSGACRDYYRHASGRIVTQWPHSMGRYRDATRVVDDEAYETGAG